MKKFQFAEIACYFFVGFAILLCLPGGAAANEPPPPGASAPIEDVRQTIAEIVKIVADFPGENMRIERRRHLRTVIEPRFDFDEMAKRSLGAQWQQRTPEEKKEFTEVFSELLARTYLSRIDAVTADMVNVKSESVDFPKASVRTLVTHKGEVFPIEYKMLHVDGRWRVYDVVIENIGLVSNYRAEFAGIIRKEEFSGLMQRLREKNAKAS